MSKSKKDEGLFSLKEVAKMTPYGYDTLRVYRQRHGLGVLIGRRWYLNETEIEFLKGRRGKRGKGVLVDA